MFNVTVTHPDGTRVAYRNATCVKPGTARDTIVVTTHGGSTRTISTLKNDVEIEVVTMIVYNTTRDFLNQVAAVTDREWMIRAVHCAVSTQQDYITSIYAGRVDVSEIDMANSAALTGIEDDLHTSEPGSPFEQESMAQARMAVAYVASYFPVRLAHIMEANQFASIKVPLEFW